MADLSVLIPARNERWLSRTVEDVVSHIKGDTEILVVLDGAWPEPGFELIQHPNVHVIYLPTAIGQRAATNLAARVSTARYVMKLDGHCAVAAGFDVELLTAARELGPLCTQIPAQYNLHVFDWLCVGCGRRDYQGPTPEACKQCGAEMRQDIVWNAVRRRTEYWRFDGDLHFQYWGGYGERPEASGEIVDVMTSLGACFFMARDRFWQLGGLDEGHGSWGQFGVEIACKSWLSGGRHVVNKRTWFSHMFRTQGGDFGFPYPLQGSEQERARQYSRQLWKSNGWRGQTLPLRWLLDKFRPVPGWSQEQIDGLSRSVRSMVDGRAGDQSGSGLVRGDGVGLHFRKMTKGCVYYTDGSCPAHIAEAVISRLHESAPGPVATVVCRGVSMLPGDILVDQPRGILTMFRQILAGLEALDTDLAFLCEHDVLYHSSHFQAEPEPGTYLYNQNVWKVDAVSVRALHYRCSQTSGLCAERELLIAHYRTRIAHVEQHGYSRSNGFEPGTRQIRHGGFDDRPARVWMSDAPNIDIRHGANLTPSRWRKEQFRNQKYTAGWTEGDGVPVWGRTLGRFDAFLEDVAHAAQHQIA